MWLRSVSWAFAGIASAAWAALAGVGPTAGAADAWEVLAAWAALADLDPTAHAAATWEGIASLAAFAFVGVAGGAALAPWPVVIEFALWTYITHR